MIIFPDKLYGESVFTSARVDKGTILFEKEHLKRLISSVEQYYLLREMNEAEQLSFIEKIKSSYPDISNVNYLRITVFQTQRQSMLINNIDVLDLDIACIAENVNLEAKSLSLLSYPSPFSENYPNFKMGSYMPHLYLKRKAVHFGFDDAVFIRDENIICASTSNIFFIKDRQLLTPLKPVLSGITKIRICEQYNVMQRNIKLSEIASFDAAFLVNSVKHVIRISRIDECTFPISDNTLIRDIESKLLQG